MISRGRNAVIAGFIFSGHEEKQNYPNENAVYGQDWHPEMIHQVWMGWKLGDVSLNYEGNAT